MAGTRQDDLARVVAAAAAEDGLALKVALSKGEDVNQLGEYNETALHWAAILGNSRIAAILMQHGADAAVRDANGRTAAEIASKRGYAELADEIASGRAKSGMTR